MTKRIFVGLFVASLVFFAACIAYRGGDNLKVLRSGVLSLPQSEDIAKVVYINMHDANNRIAGLRVQLENCLLSKGLTVTNNPSEAGYIVQLSVPAAGAGSSTSADTAVANGYAGESQLDGEGGTVLVTDALVAQRRVPQTGRRNLKTISNRTVVTDDRVRLVVFSPDRLEQQLEFPEFVTKKTAEEICLGIDRSALASR